MVESSDEGDALDLFVEPDDFYEPEKQPTTASHRMLDGREMTLRLVGHNPLWGHLLWNAGRTVADYLEENREDLIKGKSILELGAGAGLPSLICAIHGAEHVVVSDYPDAELVENLQHNINHCPFLHSSSNIEAQGYLWGSPTTDLCKHLRHADGGRFDLLILADLLFNHSEHAKLLSTIQQTLKHKPGAQALVFFTPYRPWLLDKDLSFFDLAQQAGFVVEKMLEKVMAKVMFEEDPGDEKLRRTVFGYSLRWGANEVSAEAVTLLASPVGFGKI